MKVSKNFNFSHIVRDLSIAFLLFFAVGVLAACQNAGKTSSSSGSSGSSSSSSSQSALTYDSVLAWFKNSSHGYSLSSDQMGSDWDYPLPSDTQIKSGQYTTIYSGQNEIVFTPNGKDTYVIAFSSNSGPAINHNGGPNSDLNNLSQIPSVK